jgi:hypothetical protein
MSAQPVCKGCGQPIWGNYLTALDACWHPEHFVCAACGRPISGAQFRQHQDLPYHIGCYNNTIAPRCAYCGRPLVKEYLIDHWGTRYCKEHQNQFPRCAYCRRMVPPQEQEANAEDVRCAVCRSSAIESADDARPIFKKLIQWVSGQGLRYNNLPLSLELCGHAKLAYYLNERGQSHSLGATMSKTYSLDGRVVRSEVTGVAVLLGLPSILFQGVTIHELGHVWLIVHGIQDLPSWAEEGFCELLSYRYYNELNTPESHYHATNIERNPDPTYGEGFRRIRASADAMGFARFVEVLQTTKRLP